MTATQQAPRDIFPVLPPAQYDEPESPFLIQVDEFLRVSRARSTFGVSGKGLTAAVLDTGLNTAHVDFVGRVLVQRNFTNDNQGDPQNAADGNGHGTNVAGIIVANGDHIGIAPEANVIPLKVLHNGGGGSFEAIGKALQWVIDNRETYNISVVCMSLGSESNYTDDNFIDDEIRKKIQNLRKTNVAVVIAAGNDYFKYGSKQGMSYPGIFRECISVGAVYDADEGAFTYHDGAKAFSTRAGQITPFSQRLHPSVNPNTYTDVFAPGAPVTSSGIRGEHGESTQHGTSQATPVTAGLILLMQEFYQKVTGKLPAIEDVVTWLRRGGITIQDSEGKYDNVTHTNLDFIRVDAVLALDAVKRALHKQRLEKSGTVGGA